MWNLLYTINTMNTVRGNIPIINNQEVIRFSIEFKKFI